MEIRGKWDWNHRLENLFKVTLHPIIRMLLRILRPSEQRLLSRDLLCMISWRCRCKTKWRLTWGNRPWCRFLVRNPQKQTAEKRSSRVVYASGGEARISAQLRFFNIIVSTGVYGRYFPPGEPGCLLLLSNTITCLCLLSVWVKHAESHRCLLLKIQTLWLIVALKAKLMINTVSRVFLLGAISVQSA